jgi:hypothetical protein
MAYKPADKSAAYVTQVSLKWDFFYIFENLLTISTKPRLRGAVFSPEIYLRERLGISHSGVVSGSSHISGFCPVL